jgi:hypothetical protein
METGKESVGHTLKFTDPTAGMPDSSVMGWAGSNSWHPLHHQVKRREPVRLFL